MTTTHSKTILLLVYCLGTIVLFCSTVQAAPPTPAVIAEGRVAGHVWLDVNCDGLKDAPEGDVALAGIVQLVSAGDDRILNAGDHAQVYYTDNKGNWTTSSLRVYGIDDGLPLVYAVAVGAGSAADLGYRPSPEGGDSILSGPTHVSTTFQLQDGVTLQIGEIGVCTLVGRILIPIVAKK